jgi:hypothetical protein
MEHQYTGRISGPNHLMDLIARAKIAVPEVTGLVGVYLDGDRRISRISDVDEYVRSGRETERNDDIYVVVLQFVEQNLDSREISGAISHLQALEIQNAFVLDRIIWNKTHWKSAICHDLNCCPEIGRPRPNLNDSQIDFERLVIASESDGVVSESNFNLFENIRLRDGWLVYVSEPEHSHRITKWQSILNETIPPSEADLDCIRHTLLSILCYLADDMTTSNMHLTQALDSNPEYSLAKLIKRAIESSAPVSLLRDAFQAVTYEKLDLKVPVLQ